MQPIVWRGPLAVVIAAMLGSGCGKTNKVNAAPNIPAAAVTRVVRSNLSNEMEIASEFEPRQEVDVYAKVSGYVQKLYVDWGTHVRQGQLLAVLEIPELEQQIRQDQATVHRSESDLERAREELNRADSAFRVAHLGYTRLSEVMKSQPGLVAQQDVDVAQGKDVEASAGVAGAKDALAAAEQGLVASKAALDKDKAMFDYARITAPFDGVVTAVNAYTGALLPAGISSNIGTSSLCRLSQNDSLRLVIPVPERAVPDIHIGQTIAVKVSTINETFPGKIIRFSDQIDRQTRTMHTEVEVPNPKYQLVAGMYASVQIPLHHVENVLTIPVQAVESSGENRGLALVVGPGNKIEKRAVVIGIQTATAAEIVSGLKEGEIVIFGEQGQYQPGQVVAPKIVEPSELE